MKLQTGDILLHKGNRWTSKIIRWFTKSPYTHVAIVYSESKILEIDMNRKLSIYPIDRKLEYEVYRYKDGLTCIQKMNLRAKMIKRKTEMRGYDWLKLISLGLSKLLKKPFFLDMKNYVICSEIVDILYKDLGIDLVPDVVLGHVTPDDIAASKEIKYIDTINK